MTQTQLEEFRSSQTGRVKLPESLWQADVELARQYGIWPVYMRLKERLGEAKPAHRRKAAPPSFIEVVTAQPAVLEALTKGAGGLWRRPATRNKLAVPSSQS